MTQAVHLSRPKSERYSSRWTDQNYPLAAIPLAEEMAGVFNASLVFCNVVSTDWIAFSGAGTLALYQDVLDDMKVKAQTNIDKIAGESKGRGLDVDSVVGLGGPAEEIQRIAAEQESGLIVMSTHGRSGPGRWVMGSVADAVVRRTHLPCILVRPHQVKHPPDNQADQAGTGSGGSPSEVERELAPHLRDSTKSRVAAAHG